MDFFIDKNLSDFSIKSPFSQETYQLRESQLKNSKWKQLSIKKGDKLLIKIHADVLEDGFKETLIFFESNQNVISLNENFNTECLEELIQYFYLKEIFPAISLEKALKLLNLAIFFKAQTLIKEIIEFINGISKKTEEVKEFRQQIEKSQGVFEDNIEKSLEIFKENMEIHLNYFSGLEKKMDQKTRFLKKKIRRIQKDFNKSKEENLKKNEKIRKEYEEKNSILEKNLKKEDERHKKSDEMLQNIFTEVSKYTFAIETINDGALSLSNSNTTVEKIKETGWVGSGIRCADNALMKYFDQKIFSIKIEKTRTQPPNILFGFCIKTGDNTASIGNYATKSSFMLYLQDGTFFSRWSPSEYIQNDLLQQEFNNQTLTSSLNIVKKTIKFYLNGKLLAPEKEIDLKPEEAELMCPCLDIYHKGDKVSLVAMNWNERMEFAQEDSLLINDF